MSTQNIAAKHKGKGAVMSLIRSFIEPHAANDPLPYTNILPDPPHIPVRVEVVADQLTEHLAWCPALACPDEEPQLDPTGAWFVHLPTGHVFLEAREAETGSPRALERGKALAFAQWLESAARLQYAKDGTPIKSGAQIRENLHRLKGYEQNTIWLFHENPVELDLHTHLAIAKAQREAFERSMMNRTGFSAERFAWRRSPSR